jgi:hypothetical protein
LVLISFGASPRVERVSNQQAAKIVLIFMTVRNAQASNTREKAVGLDDQCLIALRGGSIACASLLEINGKPSQRR